MRTDITTQDWSVRRDHDCCYAVLSCDNRPRHRNFAKVVVHTSGQTEDDPDMLARLWVMLAAPKLLKRLEELAPEDPLINEARGIIREVRQLP